MTHASLTSLPFLWGAATSAHQVEGANTGNDWYDWELAEGSGCAEPSGAACDHLHRYGEDIRLLAALGLNCYRFSLEWSRIEPEPGRYEQRWLDHYGNVAECCRRHGLLPILTMHHFTNPRWLTRVGGWERSQTASEFAVLCGRVTKSLGEALAAVVTINEPNIVALLGYEDGCSRRESGTARRA